MYKKESLPKMGEYYHFFDDGKITPTRHYIAKCLEIIPFEKFKSIQIENIPIYNENCEIRVTKSLYDIWQEEQKDCDFLYAKKTDYAIKCNCPIYDENDLYFVRTKNGGWFSMNIQSSWQSGRLDVDEKEWNQLLEDYNDMPKVREALINQKYS